MFELPQGAAAHPENEEQQQRLREAAEGLRVATNAAAQNAIKKKLLNRLEVRETCYTAVTFSQCSLFLSLPFTMQLFPLAYNSFDLLIALYTEEVSYCYEGG